MKYINILFIFFLIVINCGFSKGNNAESVINDILNLYTQKKDNSPSLTDLYIYEKFLNYSHYSIQEDIEFDKLNDEIKCLVVDDSEDNEDKMTFYKQDNVIFISDDYSFFLSDGDKSNESIDYKVNYCECYKKDGSCVFTAIGKERFHYHKLIFRLKLEYEKFTLQMTPKYLINVLKNNGLIKKKSYCHLEDKVYISPFYFYEHNNKLGIGYYPGFDTLSNITNTDSGNKLSRFKFPLIYQFEVDYGRKKDGSNGHIGQLLIIGAYEIENVMECVYEYGDFDNTININHYKKYNYYFKNDHLKYCSFKKNENNKYEMNKVDDMKLNPSRYKCGPKNNDMKCPKGLCCGEDGNCGLDDTQCEYGCQSNFGKCDGLLLFKNYTECGPNQPCKYNTCCSKDGYCGIGSDHCGYGCQLEYGKCDPIKDSFSVDYGDCGPGKPKCLSGTCCGRDNKCRKNYFDCEYSCQPEYGTCYPLREHVDYFVCGKGLPKCKNGTCCGRTDTCGLGEEFCGYECQSEFGRCDNLDPNKVYARCGPGRTKCLDPTCCSKDGECRVGEDACEYGCQSEFGKCNQLKKHKRYDKCGKNLPKCKQGTCCGKDGYCGLGDEFCYEGCQPEFGECKEYVKCGEGLPRCKSGTCCNENGYCIKSLNFCGTSCQPFYGQCIGHAFQGQTRCGPNYPSCPVGYCCSKDGRCGRNEKFCGEGCQSEYGECYT